MGKNIQNHSNDAVYNEDFIKAIKVVKRYLEYTKFEEYKINSEILKLEKLAMQNIRKSEEILKDFHLVKFIERDKHLLIEAGDDEKIRFRIESLIQRPDNRSLISMLKKRINKYNNQLSEEIELQSNIKANLDLLEEQNAQNPSKKHHKFSSKEERAKEFLAKESLKKQLKKCNEDYKKSVSSIESLELQIKQNTRILNNIIATNEYLSKLSRKDKTEILSHYELVKSLFDENEAIYESIKNLTKSKNKILSLTDYAMYASTEKNAEDFMTLVSFLNKESLNIRIPTKNGSTSMSLKRIAQLTKYSDFGEYNHYVDIVTAEMSKNESLVNSIIYGKGVSEYSEEL